MSLGDGVVPYWDWPDYDEDFTDPDFWTDDGPGWFDDDAEAYPFTDRNSTEEERR